jgi:hypothetical protein
MQHLVRNLLLLSVAACASASPAVSQDSQSMGDVARQARQQKQNNKDGQGKAAPASKTPKVITNDEIPEHSEDAEEMAPSANDAAAGNSSPSLAGSTKASPDQWKSMIRTQKNLISSLQSSIDKLNDSIQFAPGNCVAGCVQWNERQKQKQVEVERLRSNLDTQKKSLERLQEQARQQGYGSSIYDP